MRASPGWCCEPGGPRGCTTTSMRPALGPHWAGSWACARRWEPRSSSTSALWGVMIASSKSDGWLPADTESRIAAFTELSATAIANAESRAESRPAGRGAGGVAPGRDPGGARGAAGGGVHCGHRGGRAPDSRRVRGDGPLRVRRDVHRRRHLERGRRHLPRRRSVAHRGKQRHHARLRDRPPGPDRRLCRRLRSGW